jgi:hypothetical protein
MIYFIILIFIFDKDSEYSLVCFPLALITVGVVYYNLTKNNNGKNKYNGLKKVASNGSTKSSVVKPKYTGSAFTKTSTKPTSIQKSKTPVKNTYYNDLESLYDIDGVYNCEGTCKTPTYDNHTMNPDASAFSIPDLPAASNADDEDINDSQSLELSPNLFMDTGSLWDKKYKERLMATPMVGIPNQQVEFSKFLFSGMNVDNCKIDQSKCLRQTDLRRNNGQLNPY